MRPQVYMANLGGQRFEFEAKPSWSTTVGMVVVRQSGGRTFLASYSDLREFARAAMDATTDALVAAAVADGGEARG